MVIVMGLNHRLSMFIYSYHIETHYLVLTYSVGLSPATVVMCFNIIYHRKTHSVLIRHLQESNLLPQILGLYQRTNALGLNVFIYDEIVNRICTCAHSRNHRWTLLLSYYHIETHYINRQALDTRHWRRILSC